MVRSLSFATPATTTNSLSSLSHSTKTSTKMSGGKRDCDDRSSIVNASEKRTKTNPNEGTKDKEDDLQDADKDHDYVPVTDQAISNVMEDTQKATYLRDPTLLKKHRDAFMARAFPPPDPHFLGNKPQSKSASIQQCRPQEEVDYIKYVVSNWHKGTEIRNMEDCDLRDEILQFRRKHKNGNKYIHQYSVEEVWAPGDFAPRQVLRRFEATKDQPKVLQLGRIVISREELFDAINEWHHQHGHLGQERTWNFCKAKYWNVTQEHVKHYCNTCFSCLKKNPVTRKLKGAIKPIFSKNFRDRFQVDLIDMRKLRKRDPFGVLMRWIMTLKDHATGLTYICALPRKHAHLVAYKLQEIFGVIGYPKIFHTDNGKEFTAKCVLEFLRNLNPNILAVTGRPRRPRDQGSVENVNKLVKRVLQTVLSERRLEGQNPNWTEVMGSVASIINSQCGRGKNDVSAFESVYGQLLDHPLPCSKAEARRCWTIQDRMMVTNEPEFDNYCKDTYVIDDDAGISEVADEGYFSEDDLPVDEMDEVPDEWFHSHLMDDTATVSPTITPTSKYMVDDP